MSFISRQYSWDYRHEHERRKYHFYARFFFTFYYIRFRIDSKQRLWLAV